jgi:hypothetical protein
MNLSFTRTEYENLKKSKELDEFSPAQFHAWINSNEDLFMKGESGEFDNDLQKSEYNTLQNELAAFAKVEVWEEDKQSTIVKSEFYIREKQVDFTDEITKSENGEDETITKGIYRDTALNRKLGRVGTEFGSQIEKSRAATIGEIREWSGRKYKKQANGKWVEVSEHGMTKKEHHTKAKEADDAITHRVGGSDEATMAAHDSRREKHLDISNKLSDKEYSDEEVGSGDHKTKKSNLPENFSDVKSVLMAKTWLENKYGKDFKGSQLTDKEIDIYQDIKQKEKSGFYSYK